jgi:peptidoglycan/xylan/chitin deacetylase (PgdA/CDA1 family)
MRSSRQVRGLLRFLWAHMLAVSGCLGWAKRRLREQHAVIVLMFHRVLDGAARSHTHSQAAIVISEETFSKLVEYAMREFAPASLEKVQGRKVTGRLPLVFTFDDGWSDTYAVAFPIIRSFNVPCTVFVCPGLLDRKAPFWPERAVALLANKRPAATSVQINATIERMKRMQATECERYLAELAGYSTPPDESHPSWEVDSTMSWRQIAEMHQAGVHFGSHTFTHQILTSVTTETAVEELGTSKAALEQALTKTCDMFAYPNGNSSADTRRIVADTGFRLAVTTEKGAWTPEGDPLAIPRINVCEENVVGPWGGFSPAVFEYATVWKAWRALRNRKAFRRHAAPEICQPGTTGKAL